MVWYRRHITITARAHAGSVALSAQTPTLGDDLSHPPNLKQILVGERDASVGEEDSSALGYDHVCPCFFFFSALKVHTKTKCKRVDLMLVASVDMISWLGRERQHFMG